MKHTNLWWRMLMLQFMRPEIAAEMMGALFPIIFGQAVRGELEN